MDIAVYQRSQLPARTMRAKPPYALADQRGIIEAGEMIAGFGGKVFRDLVRTRSANEIHEFLGEVGTAQENFNGFIQANPGASFEDMAKERDRMMTSIEQSGQKLTLRSSKRYATNWLNQNKNLLVAKAQSDMEEIVAKHEAQKSDLLLESAINKRDKDLALDIIKRQSGTRYSKDIVPLLQEQISNEIDALIQKDNEALALMTMQKQAFQIASQSGYEAAFEWLNSPETGSQLVEFGVPAEEQQRMKNILKERLGIKQDEDKAALLEQQEIDKKQIYATINDSTKSYDDIISVINSSNLDEDTKQQKRELAQKTIEARAKGIGGPLDISNPEIKKQISNAIAFEPESLSSLKIRNYIGNGLSLNDAEDYEQKWMQALEKNSAINQPVAKTYLGMLKEAETDRIFSLDKVSNSIQYGRALDSLMNYFTNYREQNKKDPTSEEAQKYYEGLILGYRKPESPFSEAKIQQTLGELESGGSISIFGTVIPFNKPEDAINHALRNLGPNWQKISPDAVEIIKRKWPKADIQIQNIKPVEQESFRIGQRIKHPNGGTYEYTGESGDKAWRLIKE